MADNKQVGELQKMLSDVINAHIDSGKISYAELVGVLQLLVVSFCIEAMNVSRKDGEEGNDVTNAPTV